MHVMQWQSEDIVKRDDFVENNFGGGCTQSLVTGSLIGRRKWMVNENFLFKIFILLGVFQTLEIGTHGTLGVVTRSLRLLTRDDTGRGFFQQMKEVNRSWFKNLGRTVPCQPLRRPLHLEVLQDKRRRLLVKEVGTKQSRVKCRLSEVSLLKLL